MDNNVNVTSSTSSVKPSSGVKARITDMRDDKAHGSKPLANHPKLATGEHDFTLSHSTLRIIFAAQLGWLTRCRKIEYLKLMIITIENIIYTLPIDERTRTLLRHKNHYVLSVSRPVR
jgi:hypothetical protein